jgi:DNA-binding transcriptional LysR family regulator
MIDSERLSSFAVFAEELNFTRAAARLHISQPALHVQVSKLAESLGVVLYRRVGRSIELTHAGRELLAFARESKQRTAAFLRTLGTPSAESVVLAAGEGTLLYVLGDAIRRMAHRKEVDLRVLTRDRDGVVSALLSGEAHLGVTALATLPDNLHGARVRTAGMSLVVPTAHRLAKKRRVLLSDLEGERLIVPPAGRPHREQLERALANAGVNWERAVETTGWGLMLHYASLGVGVAIVNDICRVPRGTVARRLPELAPLTYYALERRDRPVSEPVQALKRLVLEAFRELS